MGAMPGLRDGRPLLPLAVLLICRPPNQARAVGPRGRGKADLVEGQALP